MALISSRQRIILDLPPSCIAFCPSQPQFFVVGTYFLHPQAEEQFTPEGANIADSDAEDYEGSQNDQSQVRTGSLILFRVDDGDDGSEDGSEMITHVVTIPTEYAILDLQWTPHASQLGNLLAVATSTGQIVFYKLSFNANGIGGLEDCSAKAVADQSVLVLSLAWHPWRAHVIGITLSDGCVCLCESTEGDLWSEDSVIYQTTIHNHELEAWALSFSGRVSTNVLSGGDDCVLQYSTINDFNERQLQWQDRKLHNAGITAILPLTSSLLITGSYDDHIRLISFPPTGLGRRRVLAEMNLGGGVWRLKTLSSSMRSMAIPEPEEQGKEPEITSLVILASCMHAGSRVVRLCKGGNDTDDGGGEEWKFDVLARFKEHESMNYGSDVQPRSGCAGMNVVSISFYDKLMCLWRYEGEPEHR